MHIYAFAALLIRLILAIFLFKTGKRALTSSTRTLGSAIELVCAVSLVFGLYVYLFSLILLIHVGVRIWQKRGRRVKIGEDFFIFLLALILFIKGAGDFSLDRFLL